MDDKLVRSIIRIAAALVVFAAAAFDSTPSMPQAEKRCAFINGQEICDEAFSHDGASGGDFVNPAAPVPPAPMWPSAPALNPAVPVPGAPMSESALPNHEWAVPGVGEIEAPKVAAPEAPPSGVEAPDVAVERAGPHETGAGGAAAPEVAVERAGSHETGAGWDQTLSASGSFVEPHDYPPYEFGAYGIVAFPETWTISTKQRYLWVCEAFVATLPASSSLSRPPEQQMVTVWPIDTPTLARQLSGGTTLADRIAGCKDAVEHYDLKTALIALQEAGKAKGEVFGGEGPFLLAWSPASSKGKVDALVLVADLSNVPTEDALLERFRRWRQDIELNPDLFRDGWTVDRLRVAIKDWADKWGNIFFSTGLPAEKQ